MAKAAGVSHGTASNVFSRPEIVREEVRERVKAAAEKLGYGGPDPKGRLLRAGKVNAIGVATAEPLAYFFDDPFARVVMSGIGEACDRTGAGISLVSAANDEQLAWNIRSALVDGFIVFCLENGSQLVDLTRERGLPFVALDFGFDDETISSLGVDDVEGGTAGGAASDGARPSALRHAVARARRHHASAAISWNVAETRSILGNARPAAGLRRGARRRTASARQRSPLRDRQRRGKTTAAGLEHFFASDTPPTAILAMSDKIALACARLAERARHFGARRRLDRRLRRRAGRRGF